IDEESWFPELGPVSSLRLRAAVGRSGLRPGFRQAITYYNPVAGTTRDQQDVAGFIFGGFGNPDLKPEISTEYEAGFDLGLFDGRLGLEFTYYDKTSEDALIARTIAPSLGASTARF